MNFESCLLLRVKISDLVLKRVLVTMINVIELIEWKREKILERIMEDGAYDQNLESSLNSQ